MKKFLSLVLSASMVLSSAGLAFAEGPKDIEGTKYEDAVTRLAALDVLKGYEDGTFKPGKTITRAEFAKIMANVVGVGRAAEYATGQTKFNDVPATHWAAGYINVVSDLEVINGYGDGNFGPEDQVTYAQAITMIVRALGYKPMADAKGGYPGGYLAVAAEKDVTDDVNVVSTIAATRGDVALMVDNSLEVGLMKQKTYGEFPEYEETEDTLISDKLDVEELEGVVVNTPQTMDALDDNEVEINVDTDDDGDYDEIKTVEVLTKDSLTTLLGIEVTAWANDDDEVFFIDIDTEDRDVIFDTIDASNDEEATLLVIDDDYEWAKDAKVFINFEEEKVKDVEKNMYGYVVLDDKGDIAYANLLDFESLSELVTEVKDDEIEIEDSSDVDLEDYEDGIYLYDKNFNEIDKSEIKENSVVSYYTDDEEIWMVVANDQENGTLKEANEDELTIDGKDYDINDLYYSLDNKDEIERMSDAEEIEDLMDEQVTVVLDINGDAKFIYGDVKETGGVMFGLLVKADSTGLDTRVKILNSNDEEVIYEFEEDDDFTKNESELTNSKKNNIIAFELNKDGEIAEDKFAAGLANIEKVFGDDYEEVSIDSYDVDDDGYLEAGSNRYYVEDDTVFFNVESDGDAEVVQFADFEDVDDKVKTLTVLRDEKGKDLVAVVLNDIATVNTDYRFGVVTKEPSYNSDGWVVNIKTYDESETKYVIADIKDTPKSDFKEGNILSFKINAEDEITKAIINTDVVTIQDTDDEDIKINNKWYKIADEAILYKLEDDKDIDKSINYRELDEDDKVSFLLDEDNDKISALVLFDEDTNPTNPTNPDSDGKVTFIDEANNVIYIENTPYVYNDSTVVRTAQGSIIAIGENAFENAGTFELDVNDEVADVVMNNDTITKLVGVKVATLQAVVDVIDNEIEGLPAVADLTLANKTAVDTAKDNYNGLTPAGREFVKADNVTKLNAAVAKIQVLSDDAQAIADQQAADAVDSEIEGLPAVADLVLGDKTDVDTAKSDFDDLTDTQEALVKSANVTKLNDLLAKLDNLAAVKAVADAKATLNITFAAGEDANGVENDVTLETTDTDVKITWESDNTSIVANDGSVTRPNGANVQITLTATIKADSDTSVTDTKVFIVTVNGI